MNAIHEVYVIERESSSRVDRRTAKPTVLCHARLASLATLRFGSAGPCETLVPSRRLEPSHTFRMAGRWSRSFSRFGHQRSWVVDSNLSPRSRSSVKLVLMFVRDGVNQQMRSVTERSLSVSSDESEASGPTCGICRLSSHTATK